MTHSQVVAMINALKRGINKLVAVRYRRRFNRCCVICILRGKKIDPVVAEILRCLNVNKTRCSYKAVAEVLTESWGRKVHQREVGKHLGHRRPAASWIVRAEDGYPSGYCMWQKHPCLYSKPVIKSGRKLKELMQNSKK